MAADGTISFDISLDTGKINTSVKESSQIVNKKLTGAFKEAGNQCQDACTRMSESFKQVNSAADETRAKISAILENSTKSEKSKAASIAGVYRKQGLDQAEAMRKAWSEIERTSRESSNQVSNDIVGIENQAKQTAAGLKGSLLPTLKKIGLAFAAAFTIKRAIDFGKQCIELGSDLQEVQNVVDVTFPNMSKQVNSFARNAVSSFGLSETMAKKFTGTFGAMSKAFGFGEAAAYEMSTTLTGLAGDVASFYNISQDEAYTKLKSVFTGETESLKDLG